MAAVYYEIFTPESLSLQPSGFVLLMAYIGGMRHFSGPIIGAIVLTVMQSMLSDYAEAWLLYLGVLFISIVMFAPSGLAGILFDFYTAVRRDGVAAVARGLQVKLPAVILIFLGMLVLIETSIRWSNGYGEVFEPFGIALPISSPMTWLLIAVPIAAGAGMLRKAILSEEGEHA